ncbi:unnamed protein product [Camellia sinensis]
MAANAKNPPFNVVVYEGMIREKPSSKEESTPVYQSYSGGSATMVGSVLVTNLKQVPEREDGTWQRYFMTGNWNVLKTRNPPNS